MRPDGRTLQDIRPLTIELSPVRYPEGSAGIQTVISVQREVLACAGIEV